MDIETLELADATRENAAALKALLKATIVAKGDQGSQGDKGDTGDKGDKGDQGQQGDTGPQGIKGDRGFIGPTGLQGVKGDKGSTGIKGIDGAGPDERVRVSATDPVAGFLADKLQAGNGVKIRKATSKKGDRLVIDVTSSGGGVGGSAGIVVLDDGAGGIVGNKLSFDGGDPITISGGIIHVPVGGAGGSDDQTAAEVPLDPEVFDQDNVQSALELTAAVFAGINGQLADHIAAGSIDYIQVDDPGAVGARKTWLSFVDGPGDVANIYQLFVRNDADDAWLPAYSRFTSMRMLDDNQGISFHGLNNSLAFHGEDGAVSFFGYNGVIYFADGRPAGIEFEEGGHVRGGAGNPATDPATNAIWHVGLTGDPDGGLLTVQVDGTPSDPIDWNATDAAVQTVLEAVAGVGAGQVSVTGGSLPADVLVVEFIGTMAEQVVAVANDTNSLTGGTDPDVLVTQFQRGKPIGNNAPAGTIYLSGDGPWYRKTGAGDEDWEDATAGGGTPAVDPGDIADPTIATAETVALKLNALMAAMRTAGSLA